MRNIITKDFIIEQKVLEENTSKVQMKMEKRTANTRRLKQRRN